ncbi:hypothetical protein LSAT2_007801 [Lamellibrachia satsuma]|nr:hypothetical protein LSAT2_007801 [Lamellibrachia satsuma]
MLGWLLILACCWLRPTDGSVSAGCDFPEDWQGRWYQSSLGTLVVGHNAITKKGVCREHHRDYYLVENSSNEASYRHDRSRLRRRRLR